MLIDQRIIVLLALGAVLCVLAWTVGWNVALAVVIVAAIAWSLSPLNGPNRRA